MEESVSSALPNTFLDKLYNPEEDNQVKTIIEDNNAAFVILLKTFEYLSVPELLRASQVSKLWNFVGSHDLLWRKVSLKDCILTDCNRLSKKIVTHGTQELDIEDAQLVIPNGSTLDNLWTTMFNGRKKMLALKKVKLGECSTKSAFKIAKVAPQLKSFSCHLKSGRRLNLAPLTKLENLEDLTLNVKNDPIILTTVNALQNLTNLRSLSVKRMKNLNQVVDFLPSGLVSLELVWFDTNNCDDFEPSEVDLGSLSKLTNLKNLNLFEDSGAGIFLSDTIFLKSLNKLTCVKFDGVYNKDLLRNLPSGLRSLTFDWCTIPEVDIDLRFLSKLIFLNMLTITDSDEFLYLMNVSSFHCLKHLTSLSLGGIRNLRVLENHLPPSLESLRIADCRTLWSDFAMKTIPSLVKLKKLELDGRGVFETTDLLKAISLMPSVTHLSFIDMEFKEGFQEPLSQCTNLKSLHICPACVYGFESFTIHQKIINSVSALKDSLKYFCLDFDMSFIDLSQHFSQGYDHTVKVLPWNESTKEEMSVGFITSCSCEEKPCTFLWHVVMIPIEVIEKEFFPQLLPTTQAQIRKTEIDKNLWWRYMALGSFCCEVEVIGQMEVEDVRGDDSFS